LKDFAIAILDLLPFVLRACLMATNFISKKAKLASLFSIFSTECGYKLYFVITIVVALQSPLPALQKHLEPF
jgi:hypothetical protein